MKILGEIEKQYLEEIEIQGNNYLKKKKDKKSSADL